MSGARGPEWSAALAQRQLGELARAHTPPAGGQDGLDARVRELIAAGADPFCEHEMGRSAFSLALVGGAGVAFVRALHAAGLDLDESPAVRDDENGRHSCLELALLCCKETAVYLMSIGALGRSFSSRSPLIFAAERGRAEFIGPLVQAGVALPEASTHAEQASWQPSALAALIDAGYDFEAYDGEGRRLVHHLAEMISARAFACVDLLIARGADLVAPGRGEHRRVPLAMLMESPYRDRQVFRAWCCAQAARASLRPEADAQADQDRFWGIVQMLGFTCTPADADELVALVATGRADPNTTEPLHRRGAMELAVVRGNELALRSLALLGLDVNAIGSPDATLLETAIIHIPRMVKPLLDLGARVDKNPVRSPLHVAAEWDRYGLISALLDAGVDINGQDRAGMTALEVALAVDPRYGFALTLLKDGARTEGLLVDGEPVLHFFLDRLLKRCTSEDVLVDLIAQMIAMDVDLDERNSRGESARERVMAEPALSQLPVFRSWLARRAAQEVVDSLDPRRGAAP